MGTTSACAENTTIKLSVDAIDWNYLRVRGEYSNTDHRTLRRKELPPRARRIQRLNRDRIKPVGTTSACAENTRILVRFVAGMWNYLRVRGEYPTPSHISMGITELPPRARRIPPHQIGEGDSFGTTSACAENTADTHRRSVSAGNYLRVRGEYSSKTAWLPWRAELPPRARRIRVHIGGAPREIGTTSACAENTSHAKPPEPYPRNYLRVRGEYRTPYPRSSNHLELPPRARRIRIIASASLMLLRTTSACAENTLPNFLPCLLHRNYLRVRGEYIIAGEVTTVTRELPPRARRILLNFFSTRQMRGTTSACAENTISPPQAWSRPWNYLRVRGEYQTTVPSHPQG